MEPAVVSSAGPMPGSASAAATDAEGGAGGAGEWSASSNIQVVVRCRPLSDREKKLEASGVVTVLDGRVVQLRDPGHFADNIMRKSRIRDRHYAFDMVFGEDSTNLAVYESTARHLVPDVLDGMNATVFAYGATGSGKVCRLFGRLLVGKTPRFFSLTRLMLRVPRNLSVAVSLVPL